jgi:hypothetical protein
MLLDFMLKWRITNPKHEPILIDNKTIGKLSIRSLNIAKSAVTIQTIYINNIVITLPPIRSLLLSHLTYIDHKV